MKLAIGMLVLLRTVTGFLPQGAVPLRQTISSTRRWHYNSLWVQRLGALKAATEEESGGSSSSSSSTASSESEDPWAEYRNRNNINDQVVSAMSKDGGIKVTSCTIRNMVNDMMMQHTMTDVSIQAIGRTMTCALLMSNGMQAEQTVQITLNSDGPLRGLVAIADGKGACRGFVGSPMLGDMTLEEAVGQGAVNVVKNHPDWPRPYNGITAIKHGDIDRDVGIYLAESEQRSCALAASTAVTGILCQAAGGYLIEQLPGVSDEEVEQVVKNLAKLVELDGSDQLPTNLLLSGTSPLEIMEIILEDLDMQPLQVLTPTLKCDCTEERLFRALRLLPAAEVEDLLEKEEKLEARCQFCGKVYTMGPDDVRKKLLEEEGDPSLDSEFEDNSK